MKQKLSNVENDDESCETVGNGAGCKKTVLSRKLYILCINLVKMNLRDYID